MEFRGELVELVVDLLLAELQVVEDEKADAKARGEGAIEEAADRLLVLDVLAALLEAGGQLRHHVVVVVEQVAQHLAVGSLVFVGADRRVLAQDVEGADVQLVLRAKPTSTGGQPTATQVAGPGRPRRRLTRSKMVGLQPTMNGSERKP